eukprot:1142877-Pelagomonas_calceolata.AAC.12
MFYPTFPPTWSAHHDSADTYSSQLNRDTRPSTSRTSAVALFHLHSGQPLRLPHALQQDKDLVSLRGKLLHAHIDQVLNLLELFNIIPASKGAVGS